jgi:hypothetical protein
MAGHWDSGRENGWIRWSRGGEREERAGVPLVSLKIAKMFKGYVGLPSHYKALYLFTNL